MVGILGGTCNLEKEPYGSVANLSLSDVIVACILISLNCGKATVGRDLLMTA